MEKMVTLWNKEKLWHLTSTGKEFFISFLHTVKQIMDIWENGLDAAWNDEK